MKPTVAFICLAFISPALNAQVSAPRPNASAPGAVAISSVSGRERASFDFGWRFHLGDAPDAERPAFSDAGWRALDLPHDWSIEGPYDQRAPTGGGGGYLPTGLGWYRKTFSLPESARGRQAVVQFDGVYQHSTVWINGHELGTRPFGYATFYYDLTPHLNFGATPNVIAVRVDNSGQPNSRWYSGSGIYRHTWLTVSDPLAITPFGVFVTTPDVSTDAATVRVRTQVRNARDSAARFVLHTQLLNTHGEPLSQPVEATSKEMGIAAGATLDLEAILKVSSPQLWSPETPTLYLARTEIRSGGELVDNVDTPFGIRRLDYDVNRGLLINGQPVKLRGMCIHHDAGAVGAAVPKAVLDRRLRLSAGNGLQRDSHQPQPDGAGTL